MQETESIGKPMRLDQKWGGKKPSPHPLENQHRK